MSTTPTTPLANPKVRTVTAFIQINAESYETQMMEAVGILRNAKTIFESKGYEVETLRVTTEPFGDYVNGMAEDEAMAFLKQIDDLAVQEGFIANIGPAMMHDSDDAAPMNLLKRALSTFANIEASAIIADADGVHWKTIALVADLVKYVSENSPNGQGNFNFAVSAMQDPYSPFFPGSYFNDEGEHFAIGFECVNTVNDVLLSNRGNYSVALADLTSALTQQLFIANGVSIKVQQETSWAGSTYLTTASRGDVSIVSAIEVYTGEAFGSGGTLTALRLIAGAVQALTEVNGSGLMLGVMEDKLLAQRWAEGACDIDSLLAYSAIGVMGLDTIPLPGDVSLGQLKRILGDVAVLALKCNMPLSARLVPAPWKKAGEMTDFKMPYVFNTTVHALS
jgi:uncharacterized protein (UPF0210 family)